MHFYQAEWDLWNEKSPNKTLTADVVKYPSYLFSLTVDFNFYLIFLNTFTACILSAIYQMNYIALFPLSLFSTCSRIDESDK